MKAAFFGLFCLLGLVGCSPTGPSDERKLGNPEFKFPNPVICSSPLPEYPGTCPPQS